MKKSIVLFVCILISFLAFGQDSDRYHEFAKEAMEFYEAKKYKEAAESFKKAFDERDGKAFPNDRYNAACSYALAEDVENAFYHLKYLAEHKKVKYKNLDHIIQDTDLNILHNDDRWTDLIALVRKNKEEFEKNLDRPLMEKLDSIHNLDQMYRKQIREISEKHGYESDEMKAHWELINHTDSLNLIEVTEILDTRGWLGSDIVGPKGNSALFLVIQHSDLDTQVKYLPMMREAVKKGNTRGSSLALLEDRVALGQGKRQIYGSQIGRDPETNEYYVLPLIEPEKVDERRAEVGLGSIEEYVGHWNMKWDLEKHKVRTQKVEEEKRLKEEEEEKAKK